MELCEGLEFYESLEFYLKGTQLQILSRKFCEDLQGFSFTEH